jgi:hypothetical protein
MQNSLDNDGGVVRLLVVDDVMPGVDAAAARKEVVAWLTRLWEGAECPQNASDRRAIGCFPCLPPIAPRVQQNIEQIAVSFAREAK